MKFSMIAACAALFTLAISTQSCQKENVAIDENDSGGTTYNDESSHNMGQNCMNCHRSGGQGEGIFQVAGTAYNAQKTATYSNATIKLWSGPNGTGTVKYTLQADTKGNFYTTSGVNFGSGLYPSVQGTNGVNYMSSAITTGQCNSCHGVTTDRIWTN